MNPRRNRGRRLQTGLRDGGGGGFLPRAIGNLAIWLRSDLAVTQVISPVTSAGTTPPAVTITGTLATADAQTAAATPYVEIDITPTGGARGTATFTWKLNGVTQQTGQLTAATFALGTTGLTANFPVGTYTNDNTYKANIVVSSWGDNSGNNRAAVQATGSKQPKLITGAGPKGGPALVFDGVTQFLQVAFSENQPVERYIVAQYTGSGTTGTIVDGKNSNSGRIYRTANTTWNAFAGLNVAVTTGYTSTNWYAYGVFFANSPTNLLFQNGVQVASGNTSSGAPGGVTLGIFGDGSSDPAACAIVEMMDFTAGLTTSARAQLEAYFFAKYGT